MIATLTMCHAYYDEAYVPHFLKYYQDQGVDHCYLIFHDKDKINEEEYFQEKYCAHNVTLFFVTGEWNAKFSEAHKHKLLKELNITAADWIINVDIDEHIECDSGNLKTKIEEMMANGENFCRGVIIDRIAADGSLPEIDMDIPLSEQFPLVSDFTYKVLKAETRKIPITRGDLNVTGGSHYLIEESKINAVPNEETLMVYHYKWNENTVEKLHERYKTHKNIPHRRESARFLRFWNRRGNMIYQDKDRDLNKEIMFFAIPKCASSSIRNFCDQNKIEYITHHYNFVFIKAKLKNKKAFCILRNPIERVISAYCYLQAKGEKDLGRDTKDWQKFCEPFLDINDFVQNGLEEASRHQLHFLPQSFWTNMIREPYFLCIDTLQKDIDSLCNDFNFKKTIIPITNMSDRRGIELTQESLQIINSIYQKDAELYLSNLDP